MEKKMLFPDYIFESSWEVCNKVGGIYTVLSTRAKTLTDIIRDRLIFIGPDCWGEKQSPYFRPDSSLLENWEKKANAEGLKVKVGRWDIPGKPIAVLVDFKPYFDKKNEIYTSLWEKYQVDSLHAYGDYDEASMFSYAAGLVVENLYYYLNLAPQKVIYHANEWMTGLGMLYVKDKLPKVGTIWTTHATSIGRSIAGNNKPLYDYLWCYNGDQMAEELNIQSKHSIEKQTAFNADAFTTVSDITATECHELIGKPVDVVLPNGFENDFVPKGATFTKKRKEARKKILRLANCLVGREFGDDTLIVGTSGRYEFRNKGIDVFTEAMNRLLRDDRLEKQVIALIEVPAWVGSPREDLKERYLSGKTFDTPLEFPMVTHWLNDMSHDNVIDMMKYLNMWNRKEDKVVVIFIPCYLNGDDGIINTPYYDVIIGKDLSVYPSYYEPWGYTPLESVAFKVPCITTDLAGFGVWANTIKGAYSEIEDGVKTIHRTDYNYSEVVDVIKDTIVKFSKMSEAQVKKARANADKLSKKALWNEFIGYYRKAYDIALTKANKR
ncbi:glycosyl transferase [Palleniella muris]|uniref:Glycosyl transferase n=1 Tax=Palleniella muris TaxID=3038145 RepID=A0AC61QQI1_9BACT|nr:glycogen/starch synthase [Palleniella muris]TGX82247.1 glycosyl transferase [Palleniella muris]